MRKPAPRRPDRYSRVSANTQLNKVKREQMGWIAQVDEDPAKKRRIAFWAIGIVMGVFVVVIGSLLIFSDVGGGSSPAKEKPVAKQEQKPKRPAESQTSSSRSASSDADALLAVLVGVFVFIAVGAVLIWLVLRGGDSRQDFPVYGFDEYGHRVRLNPRRNDSNLVAAFLLGFLIGDDDD